MRCPGLGVSGCGAEAPPGWHTLPQQRHGWRGDGDCPLLLGAQPVPAQCAWLLFPQQQPRCSPAEPGCSWDSAGHPWCHQPPTVPPAILCASCSSRVLAALPRPGGCSVVLRLLGKLEEMPKQWTLLCFSEEPFVMSGNLPSHLPQ